MIKNCHFFSWIFHFMLLPNPILLFITLMFPVYICLIFPTSNYAASTRKPATQRPYIINNRVYYPIPSSDGYSEKGIASWYGTKFHGRKTSNGERYNMHKMTAAHKTLPMHTMLLIQNLENGSETVVRINDRGPFVKGRVIDLSFAAAKQVDMVRKGTAKVRVTALGEVQKKDARNPIFRKKQNFNKGQFYVQIGSFAQKSNATGLQKRFSKSGHRTVIQKFYTPDTVFYRVQVYVGNDLNRAKLAEKALLDRGYTGAFVIAR